MNNDLNNILNNGDQEAERKKALSALHSALDEPTEHPEDAAFEQDTAEGLSRISNEQALGMIEQLNAGLRHQLKKSKKKRSVLPDQKFVYLTVITVLILIVVAWIVIKKMMHPHIP